MKEENRLHARPVKARETVKLQRLKLFLSLFEKETGYHEISWPKYIFIQLLIMAPLLLVIWVILEIVFLVMDLYYWVKRRIFNDHN